MGATEDEDDEEEELLEEVGEEEVNPLDSVYDITAALMVSASRCGKTDDGWVDIASVEGMAAHLAGHRPELVREAIAQWEELKVLDCNKDKTLVKFNTQELEPPGFAGLNDAHPINIVYDIIADLSSKTHGGWVDMKHVVNKIVHEIHSTELEEAVRAWEALSVLMRNKKKTLVMFLAPPAYEIID